ncbi:MAG TPA: CocE/NonD family hydrolase, partial [Actinomycetes bacterium]|nr:CocE/NonD family hydrolase [Actinomycetes bacterium]
PYRKDDLTATYRPEYLRLRDEHGYAVARVDVRGTGSSDGLATDEYPESEQRDLAELIGWLAAQSWCTGSVGMFGTSYSGFNALHLAATRPPALKAVCAIYSSDDRYTDDVHYMGGSLRLLDVVDYPAYMVAMNALPPVPSLVGDAWLDAWRARVDALEPWLVRWVEEQRDSDYWRQGSVRPGYERVGVPTMLVGGWADGYRNNTFRTYERLTAQGVPCRLLLGPWSHMSTATSLPGPHLDLVPVMARWWDRWLRGVDDGYDDEPPLTWFAQGSTRPAADRLLVSGSWRSGASWPLPGASTTRLPLGSGLTTYDVVPDVGTAAWNSCAGSLPWGQPTDQRYDDAASLTWEWPADGMSLLGHPRVHLRLRSSQPVASVSVKLCDVFPDGTSSLVCRGFLNLTHRSSSVSPQPMPVDEWVDVDVELEAMSLDAAPGQVLRLSLAGTDWPNTVAPPVPLSLTVDRSASWLELPLAGESVAAPSLPLVAPPEVEASDVDWQVSRDVLRRRTTCSDAHGSDYEVDGGSVSERYTGAVSVDTVTWEQRAEASADFTVRWPDTSVRSRVDVTLVAGVTTYDLEISLQTWCDGEPFAARQWHREIPRDLG